MEDQSKDSNKDNKNKGSVVKRVVAPLGLAAMSVVATTGFTMTHNKPRIDTPAETAAIENSVLTGVVSNLQEGKTAAVVDATVEVRSPISGDAPAREPLKISAGSKHFLAYYQGEPVSLNGVPAEQAAKDFAIIPEPQSVEKDKTAEAHLNPNGELVNSTDQPVAVSNLDNEAGGIASPSVDPIATSGTGEHVRS